MKFFAKTDFGKIRQVNQDYYVAENRKVGIFPNLFIVADGVGSNRESGFASKHCSDFVLDQLSLSNNGIDYIEELSKAYRLANTDLVYRIIANPKYKGMGTTMVATTIINDKAIIANIGDSRCYHIRNDIKQITRDHSMAEELVLENAIERGSDKYNELKSQLSRAFGAGKKIQPDFFEINLYVGDYYSYISIRPSYVAPMQFDLAEFPLTEVNAFLTQYGLGFTLAEAIPDAAGAGYAMESDVAQGYHYLVVYVSGDQAAAITAFLDPIVTAAGYQEKTDSDTGMPFYANDVNHQVSIHYYASKNVTEIVFFE